MDYSGAACLPFPPFRNGDAMIRQSALLLSFGFFFTANAAAQEAARDDPAPRPNMLVILCDDLGYGDLACYGHRRIQTPNVDRFAREGLMLTDCYAAAPNCSPSRTGLMTGRTPTRVGISNWIPYGCPMHVKRSEITVATLLRNAGYQTCHVGKWHLNGKFNSPEQPQPWDHGFDHWFATQNNALPNHRNPVNFVRNGRPVGPLKGYAAELVADEAIDWLTQHRRSSQPFFMFVCFHEPHEPIASEERFTRLYPSDDPSLSAHHGNVTQMDHAFGRLMDTLDELNLREDTFVLFTSDNGPAITAIHPHGSTGGLREKKGHVFEGGIRVPGIIRWPGKVAAGTTSDQPVSGVDVLPTLCELAGVQPPQDRVLDGTSIVPLLAGQPVKREKPLYWQFLRASDAYKVALRDGPWKLVAQLTAADLGRGGSLEAGDAKVLKTAGLQKFELYDLTNDRAESQNVASQHPDVFQRLKQTLIDLHREVSEEAPTWPQWEFARYEAKRIEWPEYWTNRKKRK